MARTRLVCGGECGTVGCVKAVCNREDLDIHICKGLGLPVPKVPCPDCGKQFGRRKGMREHRATEHGGTSGTSRPTCPVCGHSGRSDNFKRDGHGPNCHRRPRGSRRPDQAAPTGSVAPVAYVAQGQQVVGNDQVENIDAASPAASGSTEGVDEPLVGENLSLTDLLEAELDASAADLSVPAANFGEGEQSELGSGSLAEQQPLPEPDFASRDLFSEEFSFVALMNGPEEGPEPPMPTGFEPDMPSRAPGFGFGQQWPDEYTSGPSGSL